MARDPEYNREYMRDYMRIRNLSKQTKMTLACRRFLRSRGIYNMDMSYEEIQRIVEEYKSNYALKMERKKEDEDRVEAKRRHEFIYGRSNT
jgi:hypothetical protein